MFDQMATLMFPSGLYQTCPVEREREREGGRGEHGNILLIGSAVFREVLSEPSRIIPVMATKPPSAKMSTSANFCLGGTCK